MSTYRYCHDRDRTYPYSPYPDLSTPILSHQNHPRAPMPLPNPLTPSRANLHLRNALPNTLTPLHLVDAFPTQCSFNLFSSLHQVDSRHPHLFPTQCLSTFTLLHQVYSRCLIGLTTAVGRSLIMYLPRSMCLSLSFLALYISVCSLCPITHYPLFVSSVSSSVSCLHPPLFHLSLFHPSVDPTLVFRTFLTTHSRSFRSPRSLPHPTLV